LEVPDHLSLALRRRVGETCGIPQEQIFINATHTHSGPLVSEWFGEVPEPETIDGITSGTIQAIQEAQASMEEVEVKRGQGVLQGIAKDRHFLQETPDPTLQVLGFYAGSRLKGCVVNFALHPTVLGAENLHFSADYPGYVRKYLAQHYQGCTTLILNGAAGNINIGYSADASALGEKMNFRTFEKAQEVGLAMAQRALLVLEDSLVMDEVKLSALCRKIRLPLKKLPSLVQLDDEISGLEGLQRVYRECVRDTVKRLAIDTKEHLDTEIRALRLGEVIVLGIPGEPFAELGLAIKEGWPSTQVMVVGYANGYVGYLPTRSAYEAGVYEAETSVFDSNAADILVCEARNLIKELLVQEGGQ
jgi:neutral ceramidase